MLPKKNRLNLTHTFQKIRTVGQRSRIGPLSLLLHHDPDQKLFQASVIVPKTVTKLKPTRNRIRRLIFNNLRKNTARFPQTLQVIIMVYEDLSLWHREPLDQLLDQCTATLLKK